MGNQISDIFGRVGSIGHDIETGGSPHHVVDQIDSMTTTAAVAAAAAAGGVGGATDHQEEEEAGMEMAAITADDPPDGSEEEVNTPLHLFSLPVPKFSLMHRFSSLFLQGIEDVQISDIHGSAGGGGEGATDQVEGSEEFTARPQSVQRKRDSGIFPSISAATLSLAAAAILRPTPKGLYSEDLLIVAYTLDLIMLLVLGILLFGLTFALALIPNNWVSAVRAAATTVTVALLLLLLFLVAFVTYGLAGPK